MGCLTVSTTIACMHRLAGVTVETIFREEIISVLNNFHEGGFFEKWISEAEERAKDARAPSCRIMKGKFSSDSRVGISLLNWPINSIISSVGFTTSLLMTKVVIFFINSPCLIK